MRTRPFRLLGTGALLALLAGGGIAWASGHLNVGDVVTTTSFAADSSARPTASQGYDRAAFGPSWADTDRNGCDQRNDVLARDLTAVVYKPGTHECVVLAGVLDDVYTGHTIEFRRGETSSMAVQIDHVVPLSWAWQHGADSWSAETRERFATDFHNLQAVDGPTNASKSDRGPATWMPPAASYDCTYASRFAGVVSSYGLNLPNSDPDRSALTKTLTQCRSSGANN